MATTKFQPIGILGLGNMGTALAQVIAPKGYPVLGWIHSSKLAKEINTSHTNSTYLKGVSLDKRIKATTNPQDLASLSTIFITLPTKYLSSVLTPLQSAINQDTVLIGTTKGLDPDTGLTASELITKLFPDNPLFILAGPAIANEFARGNPTIGVLAGPPAHQKPVSRLINTTHFHLGYSQDILGCQWVSITKNIYALGMGLLEGAGLASSNTRAVFLTAAAAEMTRFLSLVNADSSTVSGLAGLGDLLATALSPDSHNQSAGRRLGQGTPLSTLKRELDVMPEGYNTLIVMNTHHPDLFTKENLPLAHGLWQTVSGGQSVSAWLDTIFTAATHN